MVYSHPSTSLRRTLFAGVVIAALLITGLGSGFTIFMNRIAAYSKTGIRKADGIVVLTGGPERIKTGLALLKSGKGRRLLISGVNEHTTADELNRKNGYGGYKTVFACCVDIGRRAHDTESNAAEAVQWAQHHGFKSLLLVTSDYHMPRSIVEFSRYLSAPAQLYSYSIVATPTPSDPFNLRRLWILIPEYIKYLLAQARAAIMAPKPLTDPAGTEQKDAAEQAVLELSVAS